MKMTQGRGSEGKIICLGFNKTGTSTWGKCLDLLGIAPVARPQVIHDVLQDEVFRDYQRQPIRVESPATSHDGLFTAFGPYPYRSFCDQVFDHRNYGLAIQLASNFRAFHDRPWNVRDMYKVMDAAFPGSRFVLTWRDAERWWKSVLNWVTISHPEDHAKLSRYLKHIGTDRLDKDRFVSEYLAHNQRIRDYFRGRPDFLEINFEQGDGWAPLCRFLGVPVPDIPFPHENSQTYSHGMTA